MIGRISDVRWAWLSANEKIDVVFRKLPQFDRQQPHNLTVGSIYDEVKASSH